MFGSLRNRFGIPGVISVVALVFAMLGGAYAASNSSDAGKATASAKAKKGPRGPKGATGPAGPAGPQGPAGAPGAKGDKGDAGAAGSNGTPGTPGTAGQSVSTTVESPFGECGDQEGVKLTSASGTNYVCNGVNGTPGPAGPKGDPWTAGGTLPEDATETGTWTFTASPSDEVTIFGPGLVSTPISFPIPVASSITAHYIKSQARGGVVPDECENTDPEHPGTASAANPEADPGHLCVYESQVTLPTLNFATFLSPDLSSEAGVSGTVMFFEISPTETEEGPKDLATIGVGSWAVTG